MSKIKTKIFCDIAELKLIKSFNRKKIVKGFTTNPSLMKMAGAKNYKSYSKEISFNEEFTKTYQKFLPDMIIVIPTKSV